MYVFNGLIAKMMCQTGGYLISMQYVANWATNIFFFQMIYIKYTLGSACINGTL